MTAAFQGAYASLVPFIAGCLVTARAVVHPSNKFYHQNKNGSTIYEDDRHKIVEIKNCSLDVTAPYPYALKIWSDRGLTNVRHGSLLSAQAALTTCEGLELKQTYEVIGQRIYETKKGQTHLCVISASVVAWFCHPSYEKTKSMYYNFAVLFVEARMNNWQSIVFPVLSVSRTPYELMNIVRSVNKYNTDLEGCELPLYNFRDNPHPIFKYGHRYRTLKFEQDCVKGICDGPEPWNRNHTFIQRCVETTRHLFNSSNLCIVADWWLLREPDKWYDGAALICNGTAIGIVTNQAYRYLVCSSPEGKPDFFVVASFLRVWPWLVEFKFRFDAPRYPYLNRYMMTRVPFTERVYDKNVVFTETPQSRSVSPRASSPSFDCWTFILVVLAPFGVFK